MTVASHPRYEDLRPHQQGLVDLLAESSGEESLPIPLGWGKTPALIVAAESVMADQVKSQAGEARLLILTRKITVDHWLETWGWFSAWFAADKSVVVASYDDFVRNLDAYLSVPWTRVIVDEPPATARPRSRRQQALKRLRTDNTCWLVGPRLPHTSTRAALVYLLGDMPLSPDQQPGPRSRPSLLAESLGR